MKSAVRRLALLLLLICLLSGCSSSPPETLLREDQEPSRLISANTQGLSAHEPMAALYFRYGNTGYLAPEMQALSVQRDETLEEVLIEALLKGPEATHSFLSPLFPPDVEILALTAQGDTLFVTFNEALLGKYSDEASISAGEAALRRRLCLDSLSATLTEAGLCARVQVLVYQENHQSTSLRLKSGFLDRTPEGDMLPPLTRNEETLLTPHNAASALLSAWMRQDWPLLYAFIARENETDQRPDEQAAFAAFSAAHALTGFTLSHGDVSQDGQSALLSADIALRSDGADLALSGYPLRLTREEGLWKISYSRLMALMNQN